MIRHLIVTSLLATSLLAAAFSPAALAQSDFHVTYVQRFDSGDPNSPVSMQIDIALEQAEANYTGAKWLPTSVHVQHFDAEGGLISEWLDSAPAIESPDGLWAVEHTTGTPKTADFDESPPILGVGFSPGELPVGYRLRTAPLTSNAGSGVPDGGVARMQIEEDFGNDAPPPPPPNPAGEPVEMPPQPTPYQ